MEKLYRFELAFEGEPQDVGFLQGLDDVGLWPELTEELYALFDGLPIRELETEERISCWFTEAGLERFGDAIDRIIDEISGAGWQLIGASIRANLTDALYRDEYQAFFAYERVAGEVNYVELDDVGEFRKKMEEESE